MLFSAVLSFALAALVPFTSAAPPDASLDASISLLEPRKLHAHPDRKPFCPKKGLHMIVVSGVGSDIRDSYGLLTSFVRSVRKVIPGSTNFSMSFEKHSTDFQHSLPQGQRFLQSNIEWFTRGCPHTPIVLLGYSAGAMIVSNSLCGRGDGTGPSRLPLKYKKNVIAAVTMGDETFVPHQPWDRGTCKTGEGVGSRRNPHQCKPWASEYKVYCDKGDFQCCANGGPTTNAHHEYALKYVPTVTKFIVEKFRAHEHHKHHGHHG